MYSQIRWAVRIAAASALALTLGVGTSTASTFKPTAGIIIFGDSLSDSENAARFAAELGVPLPLDYPLGKASDGRLWSERLLAAAADEGLSTRNYAVAGGTVRPDDGRRGPGLNLPAQLRRFAADTPEPLGPGHSALFWIGGNDMLNTLGPLGLTMPTDQRRKVLFASAQRTVNALVRSALSTTAQGVDTLLFVGMPDFSLIPRFTDLPVQVREDARAATGFFNRALRRAVRVIDGDVPAHMIDITPGFLRTLRDADALGLRRDLSTTCLDEVFTGGLLTETDLATCREFLFYDDIHPTAALHAQIAGDIGGVLGFSGLSDPDPTVDPGVIPLPAAGWLLLGGLALLAGLGRGRAA